MKDNSSGPSLLFILGIVFVVLKLTGVVTWPWIWVLAPFWIGLALWLVIMLIAAVVIGFIVSRDN